MINDLGRVAEDTKFSNNSRLYAPMKDYT